MSEFCDGLPVTAAAASGESATAIPTLLLGLLVAQRLGQFDGVNDLIESFAYDQVRLIAP